jgi:hypothetical protein
MDARKLRLMLAGVLFVGWIGWLAYLAANSRNQQVISRPQFLAADLWIVAELRGDIRPVADVTVVRVPWSGQSTGAPQPGDTVRIQGLRAIGKSQGWAGPGPYLLPLTRKGKGKDESFALTLIPLTPGFVPATKFTIRSTGKSSVQAADLVAQLGETDRKEAEKLLGTLPLEIMRKLNAREAENFNRQMTGLGMDFSQRHEESRIYRANTQTLHQIDEIKPE